MLSKRLGQFSMLAAFALLMLPLDVVAQTQIAAIPVSNPSSVAVNPATALVYVPGNQQVNVINEHSNKVMTSIPIDTQRALLEAAINPLTSRLYVSDGQTLYVIDTQRNQLLTTINVPAVGVAVNLATNKIYVSDFNTNVYSIDGASNTILKDISVPVGIENLAVNPVTNRVYVATENNFFGHVLVIDGRSDAVIATVQDGGQLSANVAVDPARNLIYVSDEFGTVSVLNGASNTLTATINVGGEPFGLVTDPIHRRVYVNNSGLNAIQTIDAAGNTLINSVPAGTSPEYSDIDLSRGLLYVQNSNNDVLAFSTR